MIIRISRAESAAARRLVEMAREEGDPVDERLVAMANVYPDGDLLWRTHAAKDRPPADAATKDQ
jgi:hypothetical protein